MNLLLDIGNTRIKWAFAEKGVILRNDALEYSALESFLESIMDAEIERVLVASVANKLFAQTIEQWASAKSLPVKRVCVERECAGVRVAYKKLENLGVDRWLAMIAACNHSGLCRCLGCTPRRAHCSR